MVSNISNVKHMGQISITLPDELEQTIRDYAESNGYATLSDFVRDTLRGRTADKGMPSYWERVILVQLLELEKKTTGSNDFDRAIEVLESGYTSDYKELFLSIDRDEVKNSVSDFVRDVFNCYDEMQNAARELKDDKLLESVRFPGYDGNNECDYLGYANYLVRNGYYSYLVGASKDMNSHYHILPIYRRMLAKWHEIRSIKTDPTKILTKEEVSEILQAKKYPEA